MDTGILRRGQAAEFFILGTLAVNGDRRRESILLSINDSSRIEELCLPPNFLYEIYAVMDATRDSSE